MQNNKEYLSCPICKKLLDGSDDASTLILSENCNNCGSHVRRLEVEDDYVAAPNGLIKLNEHQMQALANLIDSKKIDILESLGHDAIPDADNLYSRVFYAMNLEKIEGQISQAIINQDNCILGEIMMKLFMDYNADTINEKAQELKDEAKQEQDDLHGVLSESESARKHRENGVNDGGFH